MPLPKVYIYAGKLRNQNRKSAFFTLIGVIGACTVLFGFIHTQEQAYYVAGAGLLLITAMYFKLTYFIALELILLAGHGAILLGIGPVLQVVLPILLSAQLLIYYILSGELRGVFHVIGIVGIALLSIGFSYANVWVFFLGSSAIAIYAFYRVYQGKLIAMIWAILNSFFAIVTALLILF